MDINKNLFLKTLLVSFFLVGCTGLEKNQLFKTPPKKSIAKKTEQAKQNSWQAIQKQTNLPWKQRIKNIDSFIQANQSADIALDGYLLKAKIFLKNKKHKLACLSYHQALQSSFDYSRRWEVYRASAKCLFQEGKIIPAVETLENLLNHPKETLENKKASARLQWSFLKNKKKWIKYQLISLSHLSSLSSHPKEKKKWQRQGENLIRSLPVKTLNEYADKAELFGPFEGYILYLNGKHFFEKKDFSKAKNYFKKSLSAPLALSLKQSAKNHLLLAKKISKVNPYLIGVLVPLSGRRKALGQKILRGLYMALDIEKDSPWQIVVMDSQSHPDVVRAHLDSLFYKYHVIGLVGGLTSGTAEVIAQRASAWATPAVVFSQKNDLNLDKDFVFQNAVPARRLLKPLIDQARKELKIQKIAILSPNDLYGREYARLFAEMFQQEGGQIVEHETYRSGEADFKQPIKKLFRLNIKGREKEFEELKTKLLDENPSLSDRSRKLIPENVLSPQIDFSALFIPDSLDQTKKIADHIKYFGVKDIYLLGTDVWIPDQIRRWPEGLPLVFANLLEKNHSLIQKSSFYQKFVKLYAQTPGLFEQRAYNAGLFFKQALSRGVKSRQALQKELKKIPSFSGAYHEISISNRVFNYPLRIYKTDPEKGHILDSMPVK